MQSQPDILIIVGPTASGKSDLAVAVARKYNGEIISADSRQVYVGMDIGSNKVSQDLNKDGFYHQGIRHHVLDVADPHSTFSAAMFKTYATQAIQDIQARKKLPIICGGTGLYIDAAVYQLSFPDVPPQPKFRKTLEQHDTETLYAMLHKHDPARAAAIDPNNRRRIVRALEIIETTQAPVPTLQHTSPYRTLWIGIKVDRTVLKTRITSRLNERLIAGMLQEISNLHKSDVSWEQLEDFGLEYRFGAQYLQKKINEEEMKQRIITESLQYAKRQMTWFKRNKAINWITTPEEAFPLIDNFLTQKEVH